MKQLLLIIFSVTISFAFGQSPKGKLYFSKSSTDSKSGRLGYIDYPSESTKIMDTLAINTFSIYANLLYTASAPVRIYTLLNDKLTDSILNSDAYLIQNWEDQIITCSRKQPHFRVYQRNSLIEIYTLDSTIVPQGIYDLAIAGNKAFLSYDTTVIAIDLPKKQLDSVISTPHPFPFAGYNFKLIPALGDLIVDVEYATGAFRFSLIRLHTDNYKVDSLFHHMGVGFNQFIVPAKELVYFLFYPSNFNLLTDSLLIQSDSATYQPLAYDSISKALFLYNQPFDSIFFRDASGVFSKPVAKPFYISFVQFQADKALGGLNLESGSPQTEFTVSPTISDNLFFIESENPLENKTLIIYNLQGQMVRNINLHASRNILSMSGQPPGIYFVKIKGMFQTKKIIVSRK
jgi:type IX secretion system substrate protein